jgi:hypothetical protein
METEDRDAFMDERNGMYFDRQGREISLREWGSLRTDKVLAQTVLRRRFLISTVWLGLDHGFSLIPGARPIIFETMVFRWDRRRHQLLDGCWDRYMDRYATERDAFKGHSDICRMVHSGWKG